MDGEAWANLRDASLTQVALEGAARGHTNLFESVWLSEPEDISKQWLNVLNMLPENFDAVEYAQWLPDKTGKVKGYSVLPAGATLSWYVEGWMFSCWLSGMWFPFAVVMQICHSFPSTILFFAVRVQVRCLGGSSRLPHPVFDGHTCLRALFHQ